jgi:ADP-ribose pyrophosphatase
MPKVSIETEHVIFDDVFKIVEARLAYEKFNGKMSNVLRRLNFERGDSAAAVVFNSTSQQVILTNQFKYPTLRKNSGWIAEIVAGTIAPGETPETTIRRELLDEIGYDASELKKINTFYVSPGGSSERIHLFYAEVRDDTRKTKGGGLASEGEDIQLICINRSDLERLLAEDAFPDAKTIVGLLWLQQHLRHHS